MGAAVTPHLIVFGTLYEVNSMNSSTFKVSGNGNNNSESSDNVTLVGFGPGVTCYIGEHNYYLSGALALSRLRLETGLIWHRSQQRRQRLGRDSEGDVRKRVVGVASTPTRRPPTPVGASPPSTCFSQPRSTDRQAISG
jgi:hypothetical protein